MKNFLKGNIILSLCLLSSFLRAEETKSPVYFEIGSGISLNSGKNTEPSIDLSSSNKTFKNKNSVPVSASIGYKYSPNFRFDVNLTYLPSYNINLQGIDSEGDSILVKTSLSSFSTSLNAYYDFTNMAKSGFVPYITGGMGISQNRLGDSNYYVNERLFQQFSSNTNPSFTWKLGLGMLTKINDNIFIDFGYKFVDLGVAKSSAGSLILVNKFYYNSEKLKFKNLYSHQIMINLGFNF